jgi:inorganic triphosphatase YgiF
VRGYDVPEIEAKLRAADAETLDRIVELETVGALHVTERLEREIVDRYYDTADRDLARVGGTLRVRSQDGEVLYTYKTPVESGGLTRRQEIEEPAGDRDLTGWLYSLIDFGRAQIDYCPSDFAPVLEIHNRRTLLYLEDGEGTEVELALDRVRFSGARGETEEFEVELELKAGVEERLSEAAQWLCATHSLQQSAGTKYQRALAAVG